MDFSFFYPTNSLLTPTYQEDRKTISEAFESISKIFELKKVSNDNKSELNQALGGFDFLEEYEPIYFIDAIEVGCGKKQFHLILISVNSGVSMKREFVIKEQSRVEYEILAVAELKNDHGHVMMRPEMLSDKIGEIFRKVEVDFEAEPEFSKNYFVLSEDENLFKNNISKKMLKTIGKQKGLFIEVLNDQMLIHLKKGLSKEAIVFLVGIVNEILESE